MGNVYFESMEPAVKALVDKIEQNKITNSNVMIEAAEELAELAEAQGREDLYGYALFSRAYGFYYVDNTTQAFITFEKALRPLMKTGQWERVARDYCAMGIISNSQGNAPMAMDYYLKGVSVCERHDVVTAHAVIDCNIGLLYLCYHDLQNAELYFQKSIDRVEAVKQAQGDYEPAFTYPTVATLYFNKAGIDVLMGNVDEAIDNLWIAYDLEKKAPDGALNLAMKMLKVQILHIKGNEMEMNQCIREIDESDLSCGAITDAFDDFITYASFLQSIGRDEEFFHTIALMEDSVKATNSIFLRRRLVQLKVNYYKERKMNQEYLLEAGLYYELSVKMDAELEKSYRESLSVRVNLENEKRTQEVLKTQAATLKIKSELDALTGLHNRYKISEISESSLSDCTRDQKAFAVEILDVDYFKQYNDNYGHQEGDDVLVMVASAVRSLEKYPGVYTGRYGGDEFLILYINHSYDEVAGLAQELKNTVEEMNLVHEYSPIGDRITLSQGLYYGIPNERSKFWDYLHAADQALYEVKKTGRNNYRISTELSKK